MNHINIKIKSSYHHLNITFTTEELAINDMFYMNKLASFMQLKHSQLLCFLIITCFFFKLKTYSIYFLFNFYICKNFIQCHLCESIIINALLQVNLFAHFFINDTKILKYFYKL